MNIPIVHDKEIIIYLSGKVCPSCAEQLLTILKISGEEKKTLILANSFSKFDFVIGYNDVYLTKFECILDTNTIIKPQNEILIFNYKDKKVKNILEFRPEEKEIFIKYFNMFFKTKN